MSSWLETVQSRLTAAGFTTWNNVSAGGLTFLLAARRSGFELTKFGFSENFFIFAEFDRVDIGRMRRFSAHAFQWALEHKKIPLPRGFFESVWCYAVALADAVDESALESVRSEAPPMHWASAEIPVVYERARGKLHYFEKTPLWGSAYYAGFRKRIKKFLAAEELPP
jgi:hypothetical protein